MGRRLSISHSDSSLYTGERAQDTEQYHSADTQQAVEPTPDSTGLSGEALSFLKSSDTIEQQLASINTLMDFNHSSLALEIGVTDPDHLSDMAVEVLHHLALLDEPWAVECLVDLARTHSGNELGSVSMAMLFVADTPEAHAAIKALYAEQCQGYPVKAIVNLALQSGTPFGKQFVREAFQQAGPEAQVVWVKDILQKWMLRGESGIATDLYLDAIRSPRQEVSSAAWLGMMTGNHVMHPENSDRIAMAMSVFTQSNPAMQTRVLSEACSLVDSKYQGALGNRDMIATLLDAGMTSRQASVRSEAERLYTSLESYASDVELRMRQELVEVRRFISSTR